MPITPGGEGGKKGRGGKGRRGGEGREEGEGKEKEGNTSEENFLFVDDIGNFFERIRKRN